MIVIVDYGMGNLRSVLNKLQRMKTEVVVSSRVDDVKRATKLILPGVGSFDTGMAHLEEYGLLTLLDAKVTKERTPILGICLGMQLFAHRSEEGDAAGLGWIDAEVKRFDFGSNENQLRVPHMGWNTIDIQRHSTLLEGVPNGSEFYFVHSYHMTCNRPDVVIATTRYGYDFVSVVNQENIFGTQFHPEKSHQHGMKVLGNFVETV